MIRKMLSVLLMLSLFSACSIKSSQYSYIKSLLYDKTDPSSPEKNWNLSWAKFNVDLYAININGHIVFADENINIFFIPDVLKSGSKKGEILVHYAEKKL